MAKNASEVVSLGNQTGEGWFLTAEMIDLINEGASNIVCMQPFACLPNHVTGKGVIKALRHKYPQSNIVAIDYDPGASETNQLNRIKLMLSTAFKNMENHHEDKALKKYLEYCRNRPEIKSTSYHTIEVLFILDIITII